jgi:hypothetical protein
MGVRMPVVGALVLLSIAFAAACGGNEEASEDTAEDRSIEGDGQQTDEETAQERAEAGKESKDGKKSKRGKGKKGKARAQEVKLEIQGDSGIGFSGSCTDGDKEMEVSGQVPESFSYKLDGERLECEISKESGEGALEVALTAGDNVNSVQRISGGTLKFTYENGRFSSSTSSGSGASSSSSSQGVSSSQGGSSSS